MKLLNRLCAGILCAVMLTTPTLLITGAEASNMDTACSSAAIKYIADRSIMSYDLKGSFREAEYVTAGELATVLCRLFPPNIALKNSTEFWSKEYIHYAWMQGWMDTDTYNINRVQKGNVRVDKETVFQSLLTAADADCYSSELYDTSTIIDMCDFTMGLHKEASAYGYAAYILGLWNTDEYNKLNPKEFVTRGQLADIIYKFLMRNGNIDVRKPDIAKSAIIEYEDEKAKDYRNQVLENLNLFPLQLIDEFTNAGWKIILTTEDLNQRIYATGGELTSDIKGMCFYQTKELVVKVGHVTDSYQTILHEFGHYYLHQKNLSTEELTSLWQSESERFSKTLMHNSNYCTTNYSEYFAEVFRYYFAKGEEFVKKGAPNTTLYMVASLEETLKNIST